MNSHDPDFIAPLPTEIPDYVWDRRYDKPALLPGRPINKPEEEGQRITHSNVETALQAAKRACRGNRKRWFDRGSYRAGNATFLVYENGKVIERHEVAGQQ